MRNTRAIFLAAALLTGLPVAAYSQELKHPLTPFSILFGRLMARL